MPARDPLAAALTALRTTALAYPEAVEEHPWGETAVKVRRKVFVFLSVHEGVFRVTLKLPLSANYALTQPFAEPSGYGLGKSGWVTCSFRPGDAVPHDLLDGWVDESYRTVAPKKLAATLDE